MKRRKIHNRPRRSVGPVVALWLSVLLTAPTTLAALSIADTPLSLANGVLPNILLAIDDSGSMDSEILVPTNDGALWWHTGDQSFVGRNGEDAVEAGVINVNQGGGANSTWKKYVYLFPNGGGSGNRVYSDSSHDHYAVPPLPQYAYSRSPDYNKAYFNPYDSYLPWPSVGNKTYGNITATAAPSDPEVGSDTFDLTSEIDASSSGHTFKIHPGMPKPDGGTYGGEALEPFAYYPATFYLKSELDSAFGYTATPGSDGLAPDGSTLHGYEIKPANFDTAANYEAMLQNFANWFSYYRKRHLAIRAGLSHAFFEVRNARVGQFTINDRVDVGMKTLSVDAERDSFFEAVFERGGNSGGTPNRAALRHAGLQYQRNAGGPITQACQHNATILFTDGYSTLDTFDDIGNEDAGKGHPYEDAASDTLADISMKFYAENLRPDLTAGQVPVAEACSLSTPPPELDCNTNLHMLTYAVTLGSRGELFDPDNPTDPYQNPPNWPDSITTRGPSAVDDLWHATINGRGQMLNASKPVEIADKLKQAVTHILQSVGSAAAIATNSSRLDTDTLIFQARYDSRDWSGQVLAYSINDDGSLAEIEWDTHNCNTCIPPAVNRNILTWKTTAGGEEGTPFEWVNLDDTQKGYLTDGVDSADIDTVGPQRVAWLRGDQSLEGSGYRIRSHRLGDIVNSNPYFHWRQDYGFSKLPGAEGSSYAAYLTAKASEPAMLYVGANDGMLHGFKAEDGSEQFAYVPYGVYGKLDELADPDYEHNYYVDGSPRVLDAYFSSDSAWRSVLVGSTGAGGRSVFAIDVSEPDSVGADDILWEYRSDMGVAMSEPVIARLASGDWAAIFGNGYDNSGNVKLFVVDIEDGTLIKAIDTGVAGIGNGLGNVVPVDIDGDRITDTVYAGDLSGNVWKFDLSSGNSNQWGVAFSDQGNPAPLFTAKDASGASQPITARMTVGRHPSDGVMVYFGTGKYFEHGDASVGDTPQVQTFYGIRDNGSPVSGRDELQAQTITVQGSLALDGADNNANFDLRVVSDNAVDYSASKGWYLDLKLDSDTYGGGERVVAEPILRHGRIIFPTLIPSANPCNFGGTGWLMEVNALTGGRLDYNVFDVNGDGVINNADYVSLDSSQIPASGRKFDEMITRPGIIGAGEKEYKYTSGSRGGIGVTTERGNAAELGRQSWWQLR